MENFDHIAIDKYLNKELTKEELVLFNDKLKTDKDFAEEVKLYQEIENTLTTRVSNYKDENDLRNTLEDLGAEFVSKKLEKRDEKKVSKVFSLQKYSKYLVAASLVLFATLFFFNNGKPSYADFANHDTIDVVFRGNTNNHLVLAENAFNAKDYKTAEKELRAVLFINSTKVELQMYLGVCLLEQNYFDKAESIFNRIKDGNSIYKNNATWYLALSKLKQKDYVSCKTYLEMIPKDAEDYENAKKLLKKL